MHDPGFNPSHHIKPGLVAQTHNSCTWKVELRGPEDQGHFQLHNKFRVSLGYMRSCWGKKINFKKISSEFGSGYLNAFQVWQELGMRVTAGSGSSGFVKHYPSSHIHSDSVVPRICYIPRCFRYF